jgi:hypothetical protein
MPIEEIAYLAIVLLAFVMFIGVMGFVSVWSRIPAKRNRTRQTDARQIEMWDAPRASAITNKKDVRSSSPAGRAA